jgi:hypothetical protein
MLRPSHVLLIQKAVIGTSVCLTGGTDLWSQSKPKRRVSPFVRTHQRTGPCPRKQPNTIKKQQNIILTRRDTIQRPLNIMRQGSTKRPPITRILPVVTVIMRRITPRKPVKCTCKNTAKSKRNRANGAALAGGLVPSGWPLDNVTTPDDAPAPASSASSGIRWAYAHCL